MGQRDEAQGSIKSTPTKHEPTKYAFPKPFEDVTLFDGRVKLKLTRGAAHLGSREDEDVVGRDARAVEPRDGLTQVATPAVGRVSQVVR